MVQSYALLILLNLIGGITLSFEFLSEKASLGRYLSREGITAPGFRTVVGTLTLIVGIAKLFLVTGENWIILGDFLPALAAIVTGFTLLLERFQVALEERAKGERSALVMSRLDSVFIRPRNIYGVVSIIAAVLHFFFHSVQLL